MRSKLLLLFCFFIGHLQARQVTCISNGNWGSSSSWTQTPTCGDTVTIPLGKTITVNTQHNYLCGTPLHIKVYGVLSFINGYKLSLPCGSFVEIMVGGELRKATAGGGNSTLVEICGIVEWSAAEGPVQGYAILPGSTLPVSWLHIAADRKEQDIRVQWSTASEVNNDYFTIERSTDQNNFLKIGTVSGSGTSNLLHNYEFVDNNAPSGVVYYRVRQTDYDGLSDVSRVVAVSGRNTNNFDLIAVTSSDGMNVNVIFTEPDATACEYSLVDAGGRLLDIGSLEAGQGLLTRQFDSPFLVRGGIYILRLSNGTEAKIRRFVIN